MRLAIIGSRGYPPDRFETYIQETLTPALDRYFPMQESGVRQGCIISGGACGPDSFARSYAERMHIPFVEYRPDYATYGRKAPLFRNRTIIEQCDCVLAFWDGHSTGTMHAIGIAKALNKPYAIIEL